MKMKKFKNLYLLFLSIITIFSCEDLDVENLNQPDASRALASDTDLVSLIDGTVTDMFSDLIGFYGIYLDGLADQITSTNAYADFWGFTDQPRRNINNSTTNGDLDAIGGHWSNYNSHIYNANVVLKVANERSILDGKTDITNSKKAQALFVRGVSLGYLGMIYDKAYRLDENTDVTKIEFEDYSKIIDYALTDIEAAISLAPNSIDVPVHSGYSMDKSEFIRVANSFRGKIAMGKIRGGKSDETVNFSEVISWLNNGINSDFNPPAKQSVLFNNSQDWMTYTLSDGSGYLPVDQKIPYLAEGNATKQPADYPTNSSIILDPISNTKDSRIKEYFDYTTNFGFLRESRGRQLFTNYRHKRFYTGNNRNEDGLSTNIFSEAENDYLKAEAYLLSGDSGTAAVTINNSKKRSSSGLDAATSSTAKNAILYEYSVELHLNGTLGTNFFFMRRHNLLQVGTPLHFPVPADELEISGLVPYTFGAAGGEASASGPGWKP